MEANMQTQNQTRLAHGIDAACYRLNIGRSKLYDLIGKKAIRPIKVGTRTLIPESELQRFISEQLKDTVA
jgi:excisionase family DNA binding protein